MGNCKSGGAAGLVHPKSSRKSREQLAPEELRLIAKGGEKAVHSCMYGGKKAIVAVALSDQCHERVLKEIAVLTAINAEGGHPHIIKLLSSGIHEGHPCLVLEAVEPLGRDLNRFVKKHSHHNMSVPSSTTAHIFQQLVEALEFLHNKELIHRDLKTENVLLSADLNAKLIDFGVSGVNGTDPQYTSPYMAPEVVEGRKQDGAVDLWGLGLILHQMYQFSWNLLAIQCGKASFKPFMPSSRHPMIKDMEDAMFNLLRLNAGERWTLKTLSESPWLLCSNATLEAWSFRSSDTRRSAGFDNIFPQTPSSTRFMSEPSVSSTTASSTRFMSDSEPSGDSSGCAVDNLTAKSPIGTKMWPENQDAAGIPGQVSAPPPKMQTCSSLPTGASEPTDVFN